MKEIVVLVGGSGSGKTTIAHELEKRGYHRLVTTTTRPRREGEINHIDYHFVDVTTFFLLDRVEENKYAGHWYGLTKKEVSMKLEKYDKLVVVMDMNGARKMQRYFSSFTNVIFIQLTEELLRERLANRGTANDIEERIKEAVTNGEFETPSNVDLIIENIELEETVNNILDFLTQKKKPSNLG